MVQRQQPTAPDGVSVDVKASEAVLGDAPDGAGTTRKEAQLGNQRLSLERLDGAVSRSRRENDRLPFRGFVARRPDVRCETVGVLFGRTLRARPVGFWDTGFERLRVPTTVLPVVGSYR